MTRLSTILAVGAAIALPAAASVATEAPLSPSGAVKSPFELTSSYEVLRPTGLTDVRPGTPASVVLPSTTGAITLDLEPHSIRSLDFVVFVQDAMGILPHQIEAPRTYRGAIAGLPESQAYGSIIDGRFHGAFRVAPTDSWTSVTPLDETIPGADPRDHLVIDSATMADDGHGCGLTGDAAELAGRILDRDEIADRPVGPMAPRRGTFGVEAPSAGGGDVAEASAGGITRVTDILIDTDTQFFFLNGGSVSNTVNDIEFVMNGVAFVYERNVDITFEITGILVRTVPGDQPYTSSDAGVRLDQMFGEWNSFPLSTIRRDVAHLFTGVNLNGSTIGIARLAAVCSPGIAYGLSQSRFSSLADYRVSLTAHEIGHNYSSEHCSGGNCFIMCSAVDGCGGTTGGNLKFGPSATSQIVAYRNSVGCLDIEPAPLSPPFEETWETTTIDTTRWSWFIDTGVVDPATVTPPSGPFAAELRSLNDFLFRQGDLRSNVIDMSGPGPNFIGFDVAWSGLEAGESLSVQYRSSADRWVELLPLVSSGTTQEFTRITLPVPPLGAHDGFRLRFLLNADDINDRAYVDNINVGPLVEEPSCDGDTNDDGVVDFDDLIEALSTYGPCPGCPADFDGNDEVDFSDLVTILGAFGPCP